MRVLVELCERLVVAFRNRRRVNLRYNLPNCFAYSFGSDLPQIAQAMATNQPAIVNENKLRRATSVIFACLRFTAIKIGITLMNKTAKSSNVLIWGPHGGEQSEYIPPLAHSGRIVAYPSITPLLTLSKWLTKRRLRTLHRQNGPFRRWWKRPLPCSCGFQSFSMDETLDKMIGARGRKHKQGSRPPETPHRPLS
jgi:hypothetical protein